VTLNYGQTVEELLPYIRFRNEKHFSPFKSESDLTQLPNERQKIEALLLNKKKILNFSSNDAAHLPSLYIDDEDLQDLILEVPKKLKFINEYNWKKIAESIEEVCEKYQKV
jgi:hypothetical protein